MDKDDVKAESAVQSRRPLNDVTVKGSEDAFAHTNGPPSPPCLRPSQILRANFLFSAFSSQNSIRENISLHFLLGKIFPDKIFSGQICSWPGAVSFFLGGRARKITPVIYPLIFENFFGHENSRRESFLTFSFTDRRHFSSRCRI